VQIYDLLLSHGRDAGFRVTGEAYFRTATNEEAFPRVRGEWPCNLVKRGEPDCIWMNEDGTPAAVFEVEGYDVEDKYTGGLMKDAIYLSAPQFAHSVKAIILFGLKPDGTYKNKPLFPVAQLQQWVLARCSALAQLYRIPSNIPIVLDDEVEGGLLAEWVRLARGA
jgi:hypothetical protein